jgi:hypothetical protein
VAIRLDPDILIVDEALSVGDYYFQQRCIRRILQMKRQGVTIVFVSHDLEAVRVLTERVNWMDHGCVLLEGKTDDVVAKCVAAMVSRGGKEGVEEEPIGKPISKATEGLDLSPDALARIPAFISGIPNVDNRFGNGKARVAGMGTFTAAGEPAGTASQGDRICIRISDEFVREVAHPNVGFMLRNRLGQDVTGTNVMFEGHRLEPARPGD